MEKLIRTSDGITVSIPQNESPNGELAKKLVDAERAKRTQSFTEHANIKYDSEQALRTKRFNEREVGLEMGGEVVRNAPESTIKVGKGIYDVATNVFTKPLESLEGIGDAVVGGLANASDTYRDYVIEQGKKNGQRAQVAIDKFTSGADMSLPKNQKRLVELEKARDDAFGNYERLDKKADAIGDYYSKRLGGWKEIKQTIAEDPAGALLDMSGIAGILKSIVKQTIKQPYTRVTDITGNKNPKLENFGNKVNAGADKVLNATNPLSWIGSGANAGANMALSTLDLVTSRVGRSAVKGALSAGADSVKGMVPYFGRNARKRAEGFRDAKSGKLSETSIAQLAKDKLTDAQIAKNSKYDSEFNAIKDTPLTSAFEGIKEALNKARLKYTTKNGVVADRILNRLIDKMEGEIGYFQANKGLHTIEGIDALKQSLNTMVEKIPFNNKRQRMVGAEITRSVQKALVNSNPKYAKIMKQYGDDATFINEGVGKTLGTTSRAGLETIINKLKNAMKETNQTKGRAVQSLDEFGEAGQLLPQIVGSIFNNWTPRGGMNITGMIGGGAVAGTVATGGTLGILLPFLALQSPRVMGNILYRLGQAGGVPIQLLQWMYRQNNFRNVAVSYANADNSIDLEEVKGKQRNEPDKFRVEKFSRGYR